MFVSPYSAPEFDPYGERTPEGDDDDGWPAPTATGPLDARLRLPGSKSLTNRELVLAALADGPGRIRRPLHSRDTRLMVEALRALGTRIEEVPGDGGFGPDLLVTPGELTGSASIDCGLAGTVMRFVPPLAALAVGPVVIDGDPAARRRPMRATVDALRALGVDLADEGRAALPFTVHGAGRVVGGELEIDASASSQFVSALLLAAPRFERGLVLRHSGERVPSVPHIEMTVACLAARGVAVDSPEAGVWVVSPGPIAAHEVEIEPDLSNAAPFLAAALVAGGRVAIEGWPERTTQVGDRLRELLAVFGGEVRRDGAAVVVDGGAGVIGGARPGGVDLDLGEAGELVPNLAALALLADGPSRFRGVGHLRGHETDRLAAIRQNTAALGGEVIEHDDGIEVRPVSLHAGDWASFEDHRMATTGALIGLAVPGVVVGDVACTAKTLPEFTALWARMLRPPTASLLGDSPGAAPAPTASAPLGGV